MEAATWILAFATVALVIATVVLAISTRRYTKATKQMASVAEKTLRLNHLIFVESIDRPILIGPSGQSAITVTDRMISNKEIQAEARVGYNTLYGKVLDDAFSYEEIFERFALKDIKIWRKANLD